MRAKSKANHARAVNAAPNRMTTAGFIFAESQRPPRLERVWPRLGPVPDDLAAKRTAKLQRRAARAGV